MPTTSIAEASRWYSNNIRPRAGGRGIDGPHSAEIAESKARQQAAAAEMLEAKAAKMRSELVDKAGVERAARETGKLLMQRLAGDFPARVAAELAEITDPWTAECRLRSLLREALTAVSIEVRSMPDPAADA
ncbi:hypothetical protein ACW73L_21485 [Methylolobus aquaticus]